LARKILLADDSVTAQNMGRKILADAGYEVITVNNGSAALKKIAEQKPDLIVLDVYMPGYSGLEVCQRLKEVGETARIPVLLTVGKLEPFKPEEAKRVRADGFIVKPFEASELLSALSKLEDKIVPRPEPSKPGRFARASAAIEEARIDKTVAIDEDSGWKNRISFPTKKKETARSEDANDAAVYNPLNKDLRTVVEHKPAEKSYAPKAEEERVDLGALAAVGLPKDVTPEEIAALAAAAAQVKGITDDKVEHAAQAVAPAMTESPAAAAAAEEKAQERIEAKVEAANIETAKTEAEEKIETKEADLLTHAIPADVMAAIANLEVEPEPEPAGAAGFGNGAWSQAAAHIPGDEPVTMAVAAMGGSSAHASAHASRWTAVSVALAPEDASISLEEEMQKARAAFAAAEASQPVTVSTTPDMPPVAQEAAAAPASSTPFTVESRISEAVAEAAATVAPEPAQTLSVEASGAPEAVNAAAQGLEAAASAHAEPSTAADVASPAVSLEASAQPASDSSEGIEAPGQGSAEAEEAVKTEVAEAIAPQAENPANNSDERFSENRAIEEPASEDQASEAGASQDRASQDQVSENPGIAAAAGDTPIANPSIEVPADQDTVTQASSDSRAAALGEPIAHSEEDSGAKEPDMAETTAAAWASWRRIRESGDPHAAQAAEPSNAEKPEDVAAMAVAAGAEQHREEVPAASEESGDIANIVDSVLADLRPKIFEEISRKLGKKK
jgi:CheY-like chemotaxis protein